MADRAVINVSLSTSKLEEDGETFTGDTDYFSTPLVEVGRVDVLENEHFDEEAIPHLIALGLLPATWKNSTKED